MKPEKDKWVEEVLNSTGGMQPARPRKDLYGKLSLGRAVGSARRIPLGVISAAAACLLILFGLNITLVRNYAENGTGERQSAEASVQDIIDYYELGSNNAGI
jgi:hypothetical protein